ncbi:MAG TPA: chemotaxis protein CheB, partial [Acidimicrobiales bacterium]|nr:chemotaxis protein CheB [Acidimicrobiales bacterium]
MGHVPGSPNYAAGIGSNSTVTGTGGSPAGVVVAIGASAGGVEALSRLMAGLPEDLPAAVLVVLHVSPSSSSVLPGILTRSGRLPAHHAEDGEPLIAGRVYVAPPDRHLIVEDGKVTLWRGPRENGVRPAIDTLFRSVATTYGPAAVGVVLSGMLDDGTAGLLALKRAGAVCLVQDPADSAFPSMPASAVRFAHPDQVASARTMPGLVTAAVARLAEMADDPPGDDDELDDPPSDNPGTEQPGGRDVVDEPSPGRGAMASERHQAGAVAPLTCPECGGTLWEQQEGGLLRFHCRVGHAFSPESLEAAQLENLEQALWAAVVGLEERADLSDRLAARLDTRGLATRSARYQRQATDARRRASLVRDA